MFRNTHYLRVTYIQSIRKTLVKPSVMGRHRRPRTEIRSAKQRSPARVIHHLQGTTAQHHSFTSSPVEEPSRKPPTRHSTTGVTTQVLKVCAVCSDQVICRPPLTFPYTLHTHCAGIRSVRASYLPLFFLLFF